MATKTAKNKPAPTKENGTQEKLWWDELWKYTENEIINAYGKNRKFSKLGRIVFCYTYGVEPKYAYKSLDVSSYPKQTKSYLFSFDPFFEKLETVVLEGNIPLDINRFRLFNSNGEKPIMDRVVLMVFAYFYRECGNIDKAFRRMKRYIEKEARVYSNEDTVREYLYAESQKS